LFILGNGRAQVMAARMVSLSDPMVAITAVGS
jgi:hypothetical protein